jgi:acetyl esterase/lipase
VHAYGEAPDQVAELFRPEADGAPVVVVIHGGFWRMPHDRGYMERLCTDLVRHGAAAWNIEYRRVGAGALANGWPALLEDVAAAVDALADVAEGEGVDLGDVAAVGHSAGGHLALWTATRHGLPDGAPGAGPRVGIRRAVCQGGVSDLRRAAELRIGAGAVQDFLGGEPDEVPDRYTLASPAERLPLGVPHLLVHGTEDPDVPFEIAAAYAARAQAAGDDVRLVTMEGGGHDEHADPGSREWAEARAWLLDGR